LYIASHPSATQRIYIYDISNPEIPDELGFTDIRHEVTDIAVY